MAVNCNVVPAETVAGEGVIAIELKVAACTVMATGDTELMPFKETLTVVDPAATPAATPAALTVATAELAVAQLAWLVTLAVVLSV